MQTKSILKEYSEEELPREKMLQHGAAALSVRELLAILLRSGVGGETVLDLAHNILAECDNDVDVLARMDVADIISRFRGVGVAKASAIVAALELGKRRESLAEEKRADTTCIQSSRMAYGIIGPLLKDLDHEELWVLYLSRANRVIAKERIAIGGMDAIIADVRILLKKSLDRKAHYLILAHNHPSSSLKPSPQDKMMTEKIYKAGLLVDVKLFDHLIIGGDDYFSFADNGLLG